MANKKDTLLTASELARRLDVDPSYISKQKPKLKDAKCTFGKKFYFIKSCEFLGKDPNDPHKSRQSNLQTDIAAQKKEENWTVATGKEEINKVVKNLNPKKKPQKKDEPEDQEENQESEAKELLDQILDSIKDGNNSANRQKLDLLRQKAGVLREYFTAKNEEIKNRKLEDNLFEREEVIKILSFSFNMIRNALINLPNNYAVNLSDLSSTEIKEYVTDDINKILEDFQKIGEQFED